MKQQQKRTDDAILIVHRKTRRANIHTVRLKAYTGKSKTTFGYLCLFV